MRKELERGDIVRFKAGGVDWEVTHAQPHPQFRGVQLLKLCSGMSGRRVDTTTEYVIRTKTWEEVEAIGVTQGR